MPKRKRPQPETESVTSTHEETPGMRTRSRRQAQKRDTQHSTLTTEATVDEVKTTDINISSPPYTTQNNGEDEDEDKQEIQLFEIPFEKEKSITCETRQHSNISPSTPSPEKSRPTLIFTHGAGGGLSNPATQNFVSGFASRAAPVLTFQGTMNLKHRTRCFAAVCDYVEEKLPLTNTGSVGKVPALGGRSMGARAAVLTALKQQEDELTDRSSSLRPLVLVSYPLISENPKETEKERTIEDPMRVGILLSLPSQTKILFVIGANDTMCPLSQLRSVISRMKAQTWVVIVEGVDHGMTFTSSPSVLNQPEDKKSSKQKVPKDHISNCLRRATGRVAGEWVLDMQSESFSSSELVEVPRDRFGNIRTRILRWDLSVADVQIGEWMSGWESC